MALFFLAVEFGKYHESSPTKHNEALQAKHRNHQNVVVYGQSWLSRECYSSVQ